MPRRFPPRSGRFPAYPGRSPACPGRLAAVPLRPPAAAHARPAPPPHRATRTGVLAVAAAALLAGALLTGCDRPTEEATGSSPTATRSASGTTATPRRSPSPTNSAAPTPSHTSLPVFSELTAEPCRGYPSAGQVIALLQTIRLVPASGTVSVISGPMCAGSWQYTVLQTPGRDPLQVVTRGPAHALTLVTAGTDVCTVDVRALAPAGIRAITRC